MKKLTLLAFVLAFVFTANAQIQTPQPSPFSKVKQTVGLTDVVLEYSRPSMKGRTIFGGLVPYDKIWRTGANARTKITFSDDVTIGGQEVKAGSYAIFTKPGETSWEVIFYDDPDGFGTPQELDESKIAAKTTAEVNNLPMEVETFTMTFDRLHNDGATLGFIWANAYVGVPFEVPTASKAMKSIDAVMGGPSANDYYQAAAYYYASEKDLDKASAWVDKAVSMNDEAFWVMRLQSLIHAKNGNKQKAIEAAKRSLEVAKAAGNDDYVKMNMDSLKEWGAM